MARIGLIADTHGLMRPEALAALAGVDCILHAGDIGRQSVLDALRTMAPVAAIRGNVDQDPWAADLPDTTRVLVADVHITLVHDGNSADVWNFGKRDCDVIVCGHSHQPRIESRGGVLIVNPGSAGPRRFRLPVAVGLLHIEHGAVHAEIVELDVAPPRMTCIRPRRTEPGAYR